MITVGAIALVCGLHYQISHKVLVRSKHLINSEGIMYHYSVTIVSYVDT